MAEFAWKYCVVGNITKTHTDADGVLRYGTAAFPGGTRVYLCGKYWDAAREDICVVGLTRGKRWQVVDTDIRCIENVRCSRVWKPSVLKIMDDFEFYDCWWHCSKEDKAETKVFVKLWKQRQGGIDDAEQNTEISSSGV